MKSFYLSDIDPPSLVKQRNITSIYENFNLTCHINANPLIKAIDWDWKFNGKTISHNNYLPLTNVSAEDTGMYECVAENQVGVTSDKTSIAVQCMFHY